MDLFERSRRVSALPFYKSMTNPEPDKLEQDSIATRASLLGRLRNWEDAESWEEFTRIYWRLIYNVARGAGLADADARDVVQDTLLGVAKKVHEFQSNPALGTFRSWLLNLTRWRIADYFRAQPSAKFARGTETGEEPRTATIERVPDINRIDALWESEWKKNILETAIARLSRRINPKHAQIFDLYAVRQWPCAKVADHLGVSVLQVYLVSHRVSRLVKEEVAYLQSKLG
jgi:RNA polymerase sigma-70 factor (ECF subfamily)